MRIAAEFLIINETPILNLAVIMKREEKEKDNFNKIGKKYIPLAKAAKIYGCTPEHLNLMSRQGKLKAIKLGRNWFTTKKWLKEYRSFAKKNERQAVDLISNIKTIYPYKIKNQIKNLFKKTLVFSLASLLIVLLSSAIVIYVDAIVSIFDVSSVPSMAEDYFEDVSRAYSETFKLTKDSLGSLVFNYADFIGNSGKSFDKIFTSIKSIKYKDFDINKFSKKEKPSFAFNLEALKSDFLKKSDFSHLAKSNFSHFKKSDLPLEKSKFSFNLSFKDSIFAFFFDSLFDSVENIGRNMGNSFIKIDLSIFDFSEELGAFSENIDKSLALVESFHKKIVEAKDRKK